MKKIKNFQIIELNKIKKKDLQQIQKLIKSENPSSIIASFDYGLLKEYLKKIVFSKNTLLYVMKLKGVIISYIIIIKELKRLNFIFSDIKMRLIISLFLNLKFFTLLNLFISFYELDIIFLSKKNKLILKDNFNLNLFAVKKITNRRFWYSFFKRNF